MESMDDEDIELSDKLSVSDNARLSNPESSSNFQAATSVNTMNELYRNTRTCTHTHTCNPPGPDAVHTHTCYHTHTQVLAAEEDDKEHANSKPRRPSGNREAVRKYREKKKAYTAYLEEEVKKLRMQNQQLVRKLQGQALLQAEILRLRSILVDFKRKIDSDLSVFPYRKQCASSSTIVDNEYKGKAKCLQSQINLPCFSPSSSSQVAIFGNGKSMAQWEGNCLPAIVDCQVNIDKKANAEEKTVEAVDNLMSSASQAE